ncbi:MAG: hypothetical protein V4508_09090 [Pseudomonadota bacterium]
MTRWVAQHRPGLSSSDSGRFISASFLDAILKDKRASAASGDICGLCNGDVWSDSQEGFTRKPITIAEKKRRGTTAEVSYSIGFSIKKTGPAERRSTRVLLVLETQCWKIDDLVTSTGSIKRIVQGG